MRKRWGSHVPVEWKEVTCSVILSLPLLGSISLCDLSVSVWLAFLCDICAMLLLRCLFNSSDLPLYHLSVTLTGTQPEIHLCLPSQCGHRHMMRELVCALGQHMNE